MHTMDSDAPNTRGFTSHFLVVDGGQKPHFPSITQNIAVWLVDIAKENGPFIITMIYLLYKHADFP